jgi:Ras-related protein Rab-11A
MLIGNKCDLGTLREVQTEDAKQFAQGENLFFMETSAMDSTNVDIAFLMVLSEIYRIVSKKSLMANEELEASNSTQLLKGTEIAVPLDQETPVKSTCCMY